MYNFFVQLILYGTFDVYILMKHKEAGNIVSVRGVMLLVAPKFAAVENVFEMKCGSGITENTSGKSLHS
jgi:hypothetical protein